MTLIHDVDAGTRSRVRYRRAGFGYVAMVSARAVSFLVAILTIPLTLPYLGPERFGMWMTLNSFIALFAFANLGIGLSLMNAVARREGHGDMAGQRASISSAAAISIGIALVLGVLASIVGPLVPWWRVLNVSSPTAVAEAAPSMAILAATFLIMMPIDLAASVWNGLQRMHVVGLFLMLGSLLGLAGVAACVLTGQGVPSLVAAATGGPLVASVMSATVLALRRPDLRPSTRLVAHPEVRALLGVGAGFLLLQVAIAVATSADSLVLTQVVGPAAVAEYSVAWRLFNVPLVLAASVAYVLWPGLAEARGRGDHEWIARTHRRTLLAVCGIAVPLVGALVIVGPEITRVITQGRIEPQIGLYLAFAVATIAVVLASTETVFLSSAGVVWPLALCWGTMAVCNLALGVWLSSRIGTSGVVWSTAATEGAMLVPLVLLGQRVTGGPREPAPVEPGLRLGLPSEPR